MVLVVFTVYGWQRHQAFKGQHVIASMTSVSLLPRPKGMQQHVKNPGAAESEVKACAFCVDAGHL
jgi:hypothetical protein